jgi:hypothetical protein
MRNRLENWIHNSESNEAKIMNLLQEYGVISDNCVWAKDCGNDVKAVRWLAVNDRLMKK